MSSSVGPNLINLARYILLLMLRFVEAMGAFCDEARKECDVLQSMCSNMEKLYCDLESYYVFDKQKYTLEEFMLDVKAFKDQFKVSVEYL